MQELNIGSTMNLWCGTSDEPLEDVNTGSLADVTATVSAALYDALGTSVWTGALNRVSDGEFRGSVPAATTATLTADEVYTVITTAVFNGATGLFRDRYRAVL